ncbi:transketolase [Alsobacter soli]|uniref:Transketolase n=1 Tax=Alsobacter soli TaxID=2109933 RepID=A0A2T1HZF7_9HYPH|nr:transketolase [Alsobacter soli]PSC06968.1 transketolase [Alsobacter soli]
MTFRDQHVPMANAIRSLAMDAVEKAKSGHPGLPMGVADVATVLFTQFLKFDPTDPHWPDRDRFVLSAGHGSMLLYALLYLTGTKGMALDDLKAFRQWGSKTPGHPEYGHTQGVETTTGPLGQGIATAVGMAMAERHLAAEYGAEVVDHHTYVIASDGDLMEGISQEAIALAGHLRLSKLIVLFDDNGISIDGPVSLSDSVDQVARFKAAGWAAEHVDGHDPDAIAAAIQRAQRADRPTMIACKTVIGYGAPKRAGTSKAHGEPLGAEELAAAKAHLNISPEPFFVPEDVLQAWRSAGARGKPAHEAWRERLAKLDAAKRAEFERRQRGDLPAGFKAAMKRLKEKLAAEPPTLATRKSSELALETITEAVPELVLGSADLTGSNNTRTKNLTAITPADFSGRYIHYGIREHGMAAAMNGMALHKGVIPAGGTFMVFTDYCRPAIRLSALMGQRVVYVMTHDSIGLGEDGPTHQPVEHLAALRAIPNLNVFRPADAMETAECWQLALEHAGTPSILALTRQNLTPFRKDATDENRCAKGAYEAAQAEGGEAAVSIFASGSEVEIALGARKLLADKGVAARVVSVPCMDLFLAQPDDVRAQIVGKAKVKIAVEAGLRMGWDAVIGSDGLFVGMAGFGASAPYKELYAHFGITAEAVAEKAAARV